MMEVEEKIRRVFDLYAKFGHEAYIGEEVSQLQHAQQCAQGSTDLNFPPFLFSCKLTFLLNN